MRPQPLKTNWRLALIGICGAAAVAVGAVFAGLAIFSSGRSSLPPLPTTGDYRPISIPSPVEGGVADPDSMARQGQDLFSVLSPGPGAHQYQVTVSNASGIGFINALDWRPPRGMTIVKVTGSSAGHCELAGTAGMISCGGLNLRPPTCTCRGDGGRLVITFVAGQHSGLLAGASSIVSATPVLKVIPAFVQGPDVQRCAPGQESTAAKPCSKS